MGMLRRPRYLIIMTVTRISFTAINHRPIEILWAWGVTYNIVRRSAKPADPNWAKDHNISSLFSYSHVNLTNFPESKVHGANMGPTWVLSAPDGPHVGPMNLAIWVKKSCEYAPWHIQRPRINTLTTCSNRFTRRCSTAHFPPNTLNWHIIFNIYMHKMWF